ncbi:hypothetical protein [Prevotella sp.]|uniref:hypothetical protein n=1 Tax=Prevotella sp. TaxID=59823 RepID=UPI002F922509
MDNFLYAQILSDIFIGGFYEVVAVGSPCLSRTFAGGLLSDDGCFSYLFSWEWRMAFSSLWQSGVVCYEA